MKSLFAGTDHLEQGNQLGLFIPQKKQGHNENVLLLTQEADHTLFGKTLCTHRTSAYICCACDKVINTFSFITNNSVVITWRNLCVTQDCWYL